MFVVMELKDMVERARRRTKSRWQPHMGNKHGFFARMSLEPDENDVTLRPFRKVAEVSETHTTNGESV